jgi:hypothetical protein
MRQAEFPGHSHCIHGEVGLKMAVFWVAAPCSLLEIYRRFIIGATMMDAASTY